MQLPIWWRRGRQRPWTSIPRINPRHPLAQGLRFYMYSHGSTYLDIIQGGFGKFSANGTVNFGTYPFGSGAQFLGQGGNNDKWAYMPSSIGAQVGATAPYSSAFGSFFTSSTLVATGGIAVTADTSGNTGVAFFTDPTGAKVRHYWANGGSSTDFNQAPAANTFQSWLISVSSATAATLYANGAVDQNVAPASTTSTITSPSLVIGNGASGENLNSDSGPKGWIPYFAGWNRALTSGEALLLHTDPYCFLIYPEDEMIAAMINIAAAVTTPAFGWQPEAQALRSPIRKTEAGPQFVASPASQNFQWYNAGWEIPPPMVRRITANRQPVMPKEDGISDIQRNWVNDGWEVQPPQPPHPRTEKFGSIAPKEDGNEGTFQFWRNAGWEIQSPMIEHPRPEKAGAIMPKDDGIQAIFQNWRNAGWEVQSPQPPRPTQWRAGGFAPKDDGIADILRNWQNSGWEAALHQPQHLRVERAGAIMPIEPGNQFPLVVVSATPAWQFDPTLPDMRRVLQRWFLAQQVDGIEYPFQNWRNAGWEVQSPMIRPLNMKPAGMMPKEDGIQAIFQNWINDGWEVQPWQPPHPRPERFAAIAPKEDGILASYINWFNAGWEIQAFQPPHTRWERAGGIMPIEPGNEGIFVFQTTTPAFEFDPPQVILRQVLRRWFLSQPVDGIDSPYVNWQNSGWEIQSYQPQHLRPERAGAVMKGDDGTQSQFINWAYMGWEVQPPPPPHPRPERFGSINTVFNIDAQYQPFVPLPAFEVQSPQPPRPWWERRTGALANLVIPPDVFVPPPLTPWGYEPIFTYKILRNSGLMAEMVRQGYDLQPFGFVAFGWPIQPWQPPHPRTEHGAALIFPFIELSAIVPPPPRTGIPQRTLMGMGL